MGSRTVGVVSGARLVMLLVDLKEWKRRLRREAQDPHPAPADENSVRIVE